MSFGQLAAKIIILALPVLAFCIAALAPKDTLPVFTAVAIALSMSIISLSFLPLFPAFQTWTCTVPLIPCRSESIGQRLRFRLRLPMGRFLLSQPLQQCSELLFQTLLWPERSFSCR